tara:strand:- start:197 stop:649 length:453 start_codon:yes stop_codon:yes gene_type:complete
MSRNTNDELPDDLLDRLKLLNEQPDDYDADTHPLVPLNEDDIGTFRPPEPALRVGVRDSSYLNYRAWGYISEDERSLLSNEGEVYLKLDEETFGTTNAILMMFNIASEESHSYHKMTTNIAIALRKLVRRSIRESVIPRLIGWMKSGRFR